MRSAVKTLILYVVIYFLTLIGVIIFDVSNGVEKFHSLRFLFVFDAVIFGLLPVILPIIFLTVLHGKFLHEKSQKVTFGLTILLSLFLAFQPVYVALQSSDGIVYSPTFGDRILYLDSLANKKILEKYKDIYKSNNKEICDIIKYVRQRNKPGTSLATPPSDFTIDLFGTKVPISFYEKQIIENNEISIFCSRFFYNEAVKAYAGLAIEYSSELLHISSEISEYGTEEKIRADAAISDMTKLGPKQQPENLSGGESKNINKAASPQVMSKQDWARKVKVFIDYWETMKIKADEGDLSLQNSVGKACATEYMQTKSAEEKECAIKYLGMAAAQGHQPAQKLLDEIKSNN